MAKSRAELLAEARAALRDIDRRHGEYQDEILAQFQTKLDAIIEEAIATINEDLGNRLNLADDGTIIRSLKNLRLLQTLNTRFVAEMRKGGLDALARTFVGEFPGQLPLMSETLAVLSKAMKIPLSGSILAVKDEQVLAEKQQATLDGIREIVAKVGMTAKRRALAQFNGLKPRQLEQLLADTFEVSSGQAQSLAATGMAVFYRTATDRAFGIIEKKRSLSYTYDGPFDALNRPFCHDLEFRARRGETWTRAQIDAMENGQLPDVMQTAGGYRCRHQWRIALGDDEPKRAPQGKASAAAANRARGDLAAKRSAARRGASKIAGNYDSTAPYEQQKANLLAQAEVYEKAGLKVPGPLRASLDRLIAAAPSRLKLYEISVQLKRAKAAASTLETHGARSAFHRQLRLIARLEAELKAVKA